MWNHVVPVFLSYSFNKFKIFYKHYTKMPLLTNLDFCLSDPTFIVDCLVKITPDCCWFYECIERFIFVTFAEKGNTFSNHHYRYIKFRLTSIYEFWYAYKLFLLIRYYLFVSGCRLTSCNIRIYFGCALEERCKTDIFVLVFMTK